MSYGKSTSLSDHNGHFVTGKIHPVHLIETFILETQKYIQTMKTAQTGWRNGSNHKNVIETLLFLRLVSIKCYL